MGVAGFVTVEEQQAHRAPLFAMVVMLLGRWYPGILSWKYRVPTIGASFLCAIQSPAGVISYHLPMHLWDALDIPERDGSSPPLPDKFAIDRPEKLLNFVAWLAEHGR